MDARKWRRVLLPAVLAAGAAMTCDSPTAPVRHRVSLAIQPKISFALNSFAGLYVDQARLIAVRGSDSVSQAFAFSPDSTQLKAGFAVPVTDTATYLVTVQLLSGGTLMFTGQVPVLVVAGQISPPPVQVIELAYVGPGLNIDSIRIAPRDSAVAPGGQLQLRIGAWDSSGAPVSQFYVHWADSGTAAQVNAAGVFKAGNTKTAVWVYANTPTGVRDSTQVYIGAQPGVPASLTKAAGDAQLAAAGTAVAVAPAVKVADGLGNPVSGVSVTFAVASGGGSVTGASATTNALGIATVGSWTLGATAGVNTLTATASGLTAVTFSATGTAAAGAITLSVPGGLIGVGAGQQAQAVVTIAPPAPAGGLTVTVTSDSTQFVTVASPGTVTIAAGQTLGTIGLNGVAAGATLLHATAPGYSAGLTAAVATPNFINVTYDSVGTGRTVLEGFKLSTAAPTGGLLVVISSLDTTKLKFVNGAVTNPLVGTLVDTVPAGTGTSYIGFTVAGLAAGTVPVLATASNYAIGLSVTKVLGSGGALSLVSGGGQSGGPDTLLSQPITVQVDSGTTPVSGYLVDFAVATGGGSVSTASVLTNAAGQASTSWTLGALAGTQTLTVTAPGATGSPLTVSATATGSGVASTTVTPKVDTITAINGTFTLVAQAKNASGGNVTGSFTWTSRNTAVASVSPLGVVTGLTNGSTYVVATEAGGTKDSAQIVVLQKLASINVTPANRNLYLGTTFGYTAQAVDGLGTPLPSQPSFTWSTSAPAVATVDSTGKVSAIGLGAAQIKATSGTVTGIGNLSVLTAITRIAVAVDSAGSTKNDTATLVSLGVTRRYHAYAYDTLNVLMPGVTAFSWASSNPSVANVPNQSADTATATSAANGVTLIKATAQGFTSNPGAALTVSQVLASIQLSPASANVAVGGTVALTARGLDANSRYISGGSFKYSSAYLALATVDSVTGIVTGVAAGTDTIYATSGSLTSNPAQVVVGGTVPAAISFGRDTVSVGRGSQTSIPILLSTPVPVGGPAALIIKLGVSPNAYAHWSTLTVSIPQGGTSTNATLVGDSAGTTTVTATDSTGLGYAAASAVAKVTANMALASGSYYVNTTDVATTQVLLSDPSPAGGTYVTFSYGTAGVAAVSPDPAYIPAGQLAADIQIRALAAGTTTITPTAIGVNGSSSTFTASAPVLNFSGTYHLLGLGQYNPNNYVYLPTYTLTGLTVSLTSSDTTKATVTPSVSVPVNYNYAYFTFSAAGLGRAALSASAPGWTAANTDSVIVTTPLLGMSGGGQIYTTSGIQNVYVYTEDSTGSSHYRTNSLLVSLRSTDTTVMRVIDTLFTVAPGAYYNSGRVTPGALGGTAWIVATASGHTPDSVQYTVLGPPLAFSWGGRYIGAGQQDPTSVYVYVPNNATSPIVVHLTGTDTTVVGVPDSVIIPSGTNYVYFPVQGLKPGTDTLTATATGFQTATGAWYTVTSPAIILNSTAYTFNNFNSGSNIYIYAADTLRGTHYRITPDTVSILVRNPAVATVDSSTAIIAAGQYYNGSRHVTPVGVGSTWIVFNAVGQQVLDSLLVTVNTPVIQFSFGSSILGRRQHFNSANQGFYIYTPDSRSVPVPTTFTQKQPGVDSLTTLFDTIPANTNYVYADAYGKANGTDTLTVAASGYNSGPPVYITVTTPRLYANSIPGSATTTNQSPIGATVYAADSVNTIHYTNDTVTVHAVSSDTTVIKPDSAYWHIAKNTYYAPATFHVFGPGSAFLVYSDSASSGYLPDTTNTITVTGPTLGFSTSSTVLGMRQTTGPNAIYVYTQNNVTQPQTVFLKSTDTTVVSVPDSVVIQVGNNYAYFPINARDTLGTIQVQATATGFGPGAMSVQVTKPRFAISTASTLNTTSPRTTLYVYAEDANNTTHYTTDTVIVHLQSSAPSVANIDSATVTIVPGQYYSSAATWGPNPNQVTPGTAQLTATDSTAALYAYQQATYTVTVQTPTLGLGWGTQVLGIGQYNNEYVYSPDNAVNPIAVGLAHTGTARTTTTINGVAVDTVTIPAATNIVYFHVVGATVGWDTLTASASVPLFNPVTGYTAVSQGHVDPISGWPTTLSLSTGDSALVTMYARDSTQNAHYVQDSTTFALAPNANIQFVTGGANSVVITSIVIPKDAYYVQFYVKGVSQGSGQATISATNYVTYNTPAITVGP